MYINFIVCILYRDMNVYFSEHIQNRNNRNIPLKCCSNTLGCITKTISMTTSHHKLTPKHLSLLHIRIYLCVECRYRFRYNYSVHSQSNQQFLDLCIIMPTNNGQFLKLFQLKIRTIKSMYSSLNSRNSSSTSSENNNNNTVPLIPHFIL